MSTPTPDNPQVVRITVPAIDAPVIWHNESAENAIAAMSPSRRYGAQTSLRAWRRVLEAFDPKGSDGYGFSGPQIQPGAEVELPRGALVVGLDDSYASARWYAGHYVRPRALRAFIQRVDADGLKTLFETDRAPWAPKLIGFLMTNPTICETAGVVRKSSTPAVQPRDPHFRRGYR